MLENNSIINRLKSFSTRSSLEVLQDPIAGSVSFDILRVDEQSLTSLTAGDNQIPEIDGL